MDVVFIRTRLAGQVVSVAVSAAVSKVELSCAKASGSFRWLPVTALRQHVPRSEGIKFYSPCPDQSSVWEAQYTKLDALQARNLLEEPNTRACAFS